jgi:hypothetical protein
VKSGIERMTIVAGMVLAPTSIAFPEQPDPIPFRHNTIESTVRYLGGDVEDAIALSEGTEV